MSKLFKPWLILLLLVFLPGVTKAKVFEYDGQTWEFRNPSGYQVENLSVRNKPSLNSLTKQVLLGQDPAPHFTKIYNSETLNALAKLPLEINQPPKDAKLILEGSRAVEFDPGQAGQVLDLYLMVTLLEAPEEKSALPVISKQPSVNLAETNQLGINELVATGESNFAGSPGNRIHNIQVGASKYHGLILKPGEEFSFNKFLGDVDAAHGFLPELVIKREGLVPEFGGGLCQVSSTAFRAAMNAGLPITQRRNHSFAVVYYAPQGTDATIYPGVVDLKFTNDLQSHLLIATRVEGSKLYYDFYGTQDEREVAFDGPYQYDRQANGAMKAVWTRTVSLHGQTAEDVFRSNYVSPDLYKKVTTMESEIKNPDAAANEPADPEPSSEEETSI